MAKIESFLEEKGLSKNLINKIYFAQQAKEHFKHPVSVDDKNALVTVDDTVVMLPKSIVGVEECGILSSEFRPDKGISPTQSRNTFVTQKQAMIISVLLLLLASGYMLEGIRYRQGIATVEKKVENAKSKYPQLKEKSGMVLRNLYQSSHEIDTLQRKIRDHLKSISRLTSKESKIDHLKIDTKGYEVMIATDTKNIPELKQYAQSQKLRVEDSNSSLKLKGAL